jgi:hypothetical protein
MNKLWRNIGTVLAGVGLLLPMVLHAQVSLPAQYPRLANYYLNPTMTTADAIALSRWDVVVIGMEQQYVNPAVFQVLRQRNPDIIILAYVLSEEMPSQYLTYSDNLYPQKSLPMKYRMSGGYEQQQDKKPDFGLAQICSTFRMPHRQ